MSLVGWVKRSEPNKRIIAASRSCQIVMYVQCRGANDFVSAIVPPPDGLLGFVPQPNLQLYL